MKESRLETAKTPVNKWLILMLLVAIVLTVWSVFVSEESSDDETVLLSERKTPLINTIIKNASNQFKTNTKDINNTNPDQAVTYTVDALIPWQQLNREQIDQESTDVFKAHSWLEVPREKKSTSIAKLAPIRIKPVAPQAPFSYMGQMQDTPKGTQVFLMNNGVLISVVEGEKINLQWRFDSQDETSLRLTYLPLNQVQILYKTPAPASTVSPALTLDSAPGSIQPNISQQGVIPPNVSQPDINQLDNDPLDIDPPDTSELGLEELRL